MSIVDIIASKREYLSEYAKYFKMLKENCLRSHPEKLQELSEIRGIPLATLEEHEIFFIEKYAELMIPEYIDKLEKFGLINELNHMPIFHERWIIPIKDFEGNIINLVGYSPVSPNRYLYGNAKYYDRKNDMFGMENYKKAYELGWAVYVEGITDCIALRSLGFPNVFASCGTMKSDIKMRHLNQLKYGVIFIQDRDKAGDNTLKHWRVNCCAYMAISIENQLKDIDDYINKYYDQETGEKKVLQPDSELRQERANNFLETLESCINWLKNQAAHSLVLQKDIVSANVTLI